MRIQVLEQKTGVSKRNIHFYIQKGLLVPATDTESGYYNFSDEDARKLLLIKKLRQADFSISAIKSILTIPEAAEYYLRLHIEKIKRDRERMRKTQIDITEILKRISVTPDIHEVQTLLYEHLHDGEEASLPYDPYLVNHFLWRAYYTGEAMSNYQEFLREKIYKMTERRDKNPDYAILNDFLMTEDQKRIDALYAKRENQYSIVAGMSDDELKEYAEQMKKNIKIFLARAAAINQWKKNMRSYYLPMIRIYTTEIGKIAEEMLPLFKAYKNKSQEACLIVYQWLNTEEGAPLMKMMENRLGEYFNVNDYHHAVLESINLALIE